MRLGGIPGKDKDCGCLEGPRRRIRTSNCRIRFSGEKVKTFTIKIFLLNSKKTGYNKHSFRVRSKSEPGNEISKKDLQNQKKAW
jgi:hypothetical protein